MKANGIRRPSGTRRLWIRRLCVVSAVLLTSLPSSSQEEEDPFDEFLEMGTGLIMRSRYQEAEPYLLRALARATEVKPDARRRAITLQHLGTLYRAQGRFRGAVRSFEQALSYWSTRQPIEPLRVALCFNNIGVIYETQDRYGEAAVKTG